MEESPTGQNKPALTSSTAKSLGDVHALRQARRFDRLILQQNSLQFRSEVTRHDA
jgi:hypothetical protein